MRLLVAGREGQVARSLEAAAAAAGASAVALGRPDLDLTRPATIVAALARVAPDVVVNAAAYTAVDKAESEADLAFAVNAVGAGALAEACAAARVPLVHISTDYVYDGGKPHAYVETDPLAPLGVYGRSKLAGEQAVAAAGSRHVILRTSWVHSPYGNNFVKTMLRLAAARPELAVVDDQRGSPTYAPHLASAILQLARALCGRRAEDPGWGVFHASGAGETTWCGLAREALAVSAQLGGPSVPVRAITTAEYPTPARRPANSVLDGAKLARVHGLALPDWRVGVRACVGALHTPPPATAKPTGS